MKPFSFSLRYKLPLWGSALIVVTALVLSLVFMAQAYDDLRRDVIRTSEDLGNFLARSLFQIMLHDDVWEAFETVSKSFQAPGDEDSLRPELILVLDRQDRIYVSSQPEQFPVLAQLSSLGADFHGLARQFEERRGGTLIWEAEDSDRLFVAVPIEADTVQLGTLLVVHATSAFMPRFRRLADRAAWITFMVLAVLLPINWYWGRRMAEPLVSLASSMAVLGRAVPEKLPVASYPYKDELGQLFRAFDRAVDQLQEKEKLEAEVLRSERLAAVGRLAASIAHEINNPLGGLINAVSTLKRHASPDPVTEKMVSLIERGLQQIRDIVAALLVEAKLKSRLLAPQDVEDVRLLVSPEARRKRGEVAWRCNLEAPVALPSTLVRQVLINLLLNAIDAIEPQGRVSALIHADAAGLDLEVVNDGNTIPEQQMATLFEPFSRFSKEGHGLGLWISYQIVQQLRGDIRAESGAGRTAFRIHLPFPDTHE